jgi:oxygen-independent coproporphyrinogen-3 oxidase
MEALSKADRFIKGMTELPATDKKWLFGNGTDNPLRFAFDAKRVVHPSVRGKTISAKEVLPTWDAFMRQPGRGSKRAVYIHIPFCQTRCLYCGFFQNFLNKDLEDAYIERLIIELKMNSSSLFIKSHPIHAIYIGGGTPSALSAKNIERLLYAIQLYLPLANDYELTFESRFHEFDDEKIGMCLHRGVNRFSFGVQSFDTKVRRCIGRIDDREKILDRLKYILSLDNAAIIIDLMYGMPYQTMDVWEDDVMTLIQSGIDGGDLYQLNVFGDSKLKEAVDRGSLSPPAKTSEQALMFKQGVELMEKARYKRLSICHWARNTRERNIYNQLSKSGFITIPFGAGAGGKIDGYTMFVHRDIKSYMQRIDKGEKPLMFMMSLSEYYELYSSIIGQMDLGQLNLSQIRTRYDVDLEELLKDVFSVWEKRGLIEINGDFLELTIAGQFWYVNLTQAMLDWLEGLKQADKPDIMVKAIAAQG